MARHGFSIRGVSKIEKTSKFGIFFQPLMTSSPLPKLTMWIWELSRMKWPPLGEKSIFGVKVMEMDFSLSHLTIVHVRVLIHLKKVNSKQIKGILFPGLTPFLKLNSQIKVGNYHPKFNLWGFHYGRSGYDSEVKELRIGQAKSEQEMSILNWNVGILWH